ncbi:MAG: helix-turn-helix transcriptional regulator [Clostridia bacterium]|nr:helix-turn-helix transcriptional regulator [Clostridia bacterium]
MMGHELLGMYQEIQRTPELAIDIPDESGKGRIVRLDTGIFSLSSWEMMFHRNTFVEGSVPGDLRLLFCSGDGVEWFTDSGSMCLDHNEACFCLSDGSAERMCYQGGSSFSFLSVSVPAERFVNIIDGYVKDTDKIMDVLPGRRFAIPVEVYKALHDIGSLENIHSGFEMMRLDARLLETLSLCLQTALCEQEAKPHLHQDDLTIIRTIGKRIEDDPATIPDIPTLAHEYCMSVSKLTRSFRKVYGISLHAYVIGARLQKGAQLLAGSETPIEEIAEMVGGYAKPRHFSADFRKRFGLLPGEYRLH